MFNQQGPRNCMFSGKAEEKIRSGTKTYCPKHIGQKHIGKNILSQNILSPKHIGPKHIEIAFETILTYLNLT